MSNKMKVLGMKSSIVANVPTPWESLFKLFPVSQLPYIKKKKHRKLLNPFVPAFSISDHFAAIG